MLFRWQTACRVSSTAKFESFVRRASPSFCFPRGLVAGHTNPQLIGPWPGLRLSGSSRPTYVFSPTTAAGELGGARRGAGWVTPFASLFRGFSPHVYWGRAVLVSLVIFLTTKLAVRT